MTALDQAGRAWDAAYELDELLGHDRASEWLAVRIRDLMRAGRADRPDEIGKLADALEARLTREHREDREATA